MYAVTGVEEGTCSGSSEDLPLDPELRFIRTWPVGIKLLSFQIGFFLPLCRVFLDLTFVLDAEPKAPDF